MELRFVAVVRDIFALVAERGCLVNPIIDPARQSGSQSRSPARAHLHYPPNVSTDAHS